MTFTVGAVLAVCIVLTVFDEDVLQVEHMLTLMTSLGVVLGVSRSLIPEEVNACSYWIEQQKRSRDIIVARCA